MPKLTFLIKIIKFMLNHTYLHYLKYNIYFLHLNENKSW